MAEQIGELMKLVDLGLALGLAKSQPSSEPVVICVLCARYLEL